MELAGLEPAISSATITVTPAGTDPIEHAHRLAVC